MSPRNAWQVMVSSLSTRSSSSWAEAARRMANRQRRGRLLIVIGFWLLGILRVSPGVVRCVVLQDLLYCAGKVLLHHIKVNALVTLASVH